ncbi:MAG TPA: DUF2000 domain-containing protein [Acidimicrobiales bacterium]|nr:DUF2000 domain-containing protein [Acidimicrobiales bacterium]
MGHVWEDEKVAVVVREDLATWQKLNVTAFVVSGIGTARPELVGDPYEDASGAQYLPMLALPVLVFGADGPAIRRAFERAVSRDLRVAVYTEELFATGNDLDNRAAVRAVGSAQLALVGIAVAGERRAVDKALDKLTLHP